MMDRDAALRSAQECLRIEDVYVREASAWADEDYDPTNPIPELAIQFRLLPTGNAAACEIGSEDARRNCLEYVIGTGLRILKPGIEPKTQEIEKDQLLAEVLASFVVRYAITKQNHDFSDDEVSAFSENALFHMWPYWREFIQATAFRLRLPAIILPMKPRTKKSTAVKQAKAKEPA